MPRTLVRALVAAVGAMVGLDAMFGGPATGASLNPCSAEEPV
jgi:hypothetical protein